MSNESVGAKAESLKAEYDRLDAARMLGNRVGLSGDPI